jgi:hypothetical protein
LCLKIKLDNLLGFSKYEKSFKLLLIWWNFRTSFIRDVIEEIVGDISDEFDDEDINFQIDDKTSCLKESQSKRFLELLM